MTNFRWMVCFMLFLATTINYMDRQVLSLTWRDFIAPEFGWDDEIYGRVTATFSIVYAVAMLFAGYFVDRLGAKTGFLWAMGIWSIGAVMHAFCGIATCGLLTGEWALDFNGSKEILHDFGVGGLLISTTSIWLFIACRCIMAIGQSGNFPAAISVIAQYFPKKDRTFFTAIFNAGSSIGALIAPLTIPSLANSLGWEMAFIIVGGLGYFWMLIWILLYIDVEHNERVNMAEYNYILQDTPLPPIKDDETEEDRRLNSSMGKPMSIWACLHNKSIWGMIAAKFLTDGVWWFLLFWTPVYISEFYGYTTDSPMGMAMIFLLYYLVSLLAVLGGYMPTYFVDKYALSPFEASLRAMLLFASVQLLGIVVLPLASVSPWLFVIAVGIMGAAHQSWSANLFTLAGDAFPKNTIATVTGIVGFAGGMSAFVTMSMTGTLLSYADNAKEALSFMGYTDKRAAYMMLFCAFSVPYLMGWGVLKLLVNNNDNETTTA